MAPEFTASDELAFQLCPRRSAPSYYRLVLLHRWMNHHSESNTTFTHVLLSKPVSMAVFKGFIPTQRMGLGWRCKCGSWLPSFHPRNPAEVTLHFSGAERTLWAAWCSGGFAKAPPSQTRPFLSSLGTVQEHTVFVQMSGSPGHVSGTMGKYGVSRFPPHPRGWDSS